MPREIARRAPAIGERGRRAAVARLGESVDAHRRRRSESPRQRDPRRGNRRWTRCASRWRGARGQAALQSRRRGQRRFARRFEDSHRVACRRGRQPGAHGAGRAGNRCAQPRPRHGRLGSSRRNRAGARRGRGAARARAASSGTVLTATVALVGRDSARFRFQVTNAATGEQVRSLPVDVAIATNDDGMRGALDPVLSTLTIAGSPSMGAATLPLGAPPKFEAARELTTAIDLGPVIDSATRNAARRSFYARHATRHGLCRRADLAGAFHSVSLSRLLF